MGNECWSSVAEELAVTKKGPTSLRWNIREVLPQSQHIKAVFHRCPTLCLVLAAKFCSKSHHGGTSWRHERVIENNWDSLLWEIRRGHWWKCGLGRSLRPKIEGVMHRSWVSVSVSVVEMQSSCKGLQKFGDGITMRWPPRAAAAVEWNLTQPGRQTSVLQRAEPQNQPKSLGWPQKIMSESQITGHWAIYTVEVWYCFYLIVTVPWFLPLEVRSICFIWDVTGVHSLKILSFKKFGF